jgi:DNA-directed RNA polymerase specialized sigma subunit
MIATTHGGLVKNKLKRPWLTASNIERPVLELREISKDWDEKTWSSYLNWFQSGRRDRLVSIEFYSTLGDSVEKSIFEEFGYESSPELKSFCDQLLTVLPNHRKHILRAIFFEGKTLAQIAFELSRTKTCISRNKYKALTQLKREHDGKQDYARRIMRGEEVFSPNKIKSVWNQKLTNAIRNKQAYCPLKADEELLNHQCRELREVFQELSVRTRQIIYLKFWCGFSVSEIGRKLPMGLNTIDQIIEATVFKIKTRLIENFTTYNQIA